MKWFRRLFGALVILALLLAAAYYFRTPLLRRAAQAWILNQRLTKADAIVVLGGGLDTRPFEAARLYQMGYAPRILLMNPRPAPAVQLDVLPPEADLARKILLKQGVPAGAIIVPSDLVTNSYDESLLLRKWALAHHETRFIIITDLFHTRRVGWLYGKELAGTGVRVAINAAPPFDYTANDWWQHEQGLIAFQNEVLKYAYYRLKY